MLLLWRRRLSGSFLDFRDDTVREIAAEREDLLHAIGNVDNHGAEAVIKEYSVGLILKTKSVSQIGDAISWTGQKCPMI